MIQILNCMCPSSFFQYCIWYMCTLIIDIQFHLKKYSAKEIFNKLNKTQMFEINRIAHESF